MYSNGPLHMAEQRQGDQLAPTYSSFARIRSIALGTCRKRWTIGRSGERGSGISMLMTRQDDDDDCSKRLYCRPRNIFPLWSCIDIQVFLFLFACQDENDEEIVLYFLPKCFQPCLWSFLGDLLVLMFVWDEFYLFERFLIWLVHFKSIKATPNKHQNSSPEDDQRQVWKLQGKKYGTLSPSYIVGQFQMQHSTNIYMYQTVSGIWH